MVSALLSTSSFQSITSITSTSDHPPSLRGNGASYMLQHSILRGEDHDGEDPLPFYIEDATPFVMEISIDDTEDEESYMALQSSSLSGSLCISDCPTFVPTRLAGAGSNIPKEGEPVGEDLHMVTNVSDRQLIMGVFDGVGHWVKYDIDPTVYSNQLVENLRTHLGEYMRQGVLIDEDLLIGVLDLSHQHAKDTCELYDAFGSTTVTLCVVDNDTLHLLNVGDSQAFVMRKYDGGYRTVFEGQTQEHAHNTPYQLGVVPNSSQCLARGVTSRLADCFVDEPSAAIYETFDLEEDDLIFAASDGVLDNMDFHYIEFLVDEALNRWDESISGDALAQLLADSIAKHAKENALNGRHALAVTGKDDDITVVAARYRR